MTKHQRYNRSEKGRERARRYHEANREKECEYSRRWRRENPEKYRDGYERNGARRIYIGDETFYV